jgi:hypothetical protein
VVELIFISAASVAGSDTTSVHDFQLTVKS